MPIIKVLVIRGAGMNMRGQVPVLGIRERRGKVSFTVIPNVTRRIMLNETVRMFNRGALIYT